MRSRAVLGWLLAAAGASGLTGCTKAAPVGSDDRVDSGAGGSPESGTGDGARGGSVDAARGGASGASNPVPEGGSVGPGGSDGGRVNPPVDSPIPPVSAGLTGVHIAVRGDTAIVEFDPVDGAGDYRVYTLPDASDVVTGSDGAVVVRNAVYRCAGDRPRFQRETDQAEGARFANSIAGAVLGYTRTEAEAVLGYVYRVPGPGRTAVYKVGNPNQNGGFAWEYLAAPTAEHDGSDYVLGSAARDALVAKGWRDDGIAFYAPDDGTRSVYRRQYAPDSTSHVVSLFYTDGPEQAARAKDAPASVANSAERFKVFADQAEDAVALHRVFYAFANSHDVLAAGDARYQIALHQGNLPNPSVTWPGLRGETTLVVEALDQGCPFPGGYISVGHTPSSAVGGISNQPTITLDEARLPTGEVFVNGQHETKNRPKAIARSYVTVSPRAQPQMDWLKTFDPDAQWEPFTTVVNDNIGTRVYRNSEYSVEFVGCVAEPSFGPLLGQLIIGGDGCNGYVVARGIRPTLASDHFLHVSMATDIPSTYRRYPQLFITTAGEVEPSTTVQGYDVPMLKRLGPLPFQMLPPGDDRTIVVQPFGTQPELQVEFCDSRGWGVSQQCPRANIYGYTAGMQDTSATPGPWLPIPVLGDLAAFDRPVRFDVYASTERVYVFVDGKNAGCAVLPAGRMPAAPVNVAFGYAGYHIEIDPPAVDDTGPQQYWHRWSLTHLERHIDDLGIEQNAALPAWDESTEPCGTTWYVDP